MPDSQPASANRAVFLSYASQDAEAAKRICDALRAAGVEVWFDQDALVGGDAWDHRIRGQVSACALFVPVISANTQERQEGYFRLEWHLAEQRSLLIAKGRPFIVPVNIDATGERGALVPEAFTAVQWTKLPGGEASAAFVTRVKKLLGGPLAPISSAVPVTPPPVAVAPAPMSRSLLWAVAASGFVVVALIGFLVMRPGAKDAAPAVRSVAETKPSPVTALAPVPVPDGKSIAVLPFSNMSDDKDANAFFADGIHEDILTNLANIAEFKVISRTSVMQYRDTKLPLRKIAQDLGVAYVLEGSVRRAGAQVRVTGQLIRAATDEHVWAKKFDRELKDIFAIQAELATEIAGALRSVLSPQEKNLIARVPTASLDAYDLFLKVREVRNRNGASVASLQEQEQLLERAVAIDPQFGLAWAKLAWARSFLSSRIRGANDTRAARATGGREAVEKAKGIIPDSPEFFLGRGWFLYFVENDLVRAFEEFRKAAELSPSLAEARFAMAMVQRRQGHWRETLQTLHDVEQIDPANPEYAQEIAVTALSGRRYAEAEAALRRALALGRTGDSLSRLRVLVPFMSRGELPSDALLAELPAATKRYFELLLEKPSTAMADAGVLDNAFRLAAKGEKDAVRSQLDEPAGNLRTLVQGEPTDAYLWSELGVMEALLGNREEARRCVGKATGLKPESKDAWFGQGYSINVAHVYAWTGDAEGALREYQRLLQTMAPRGGFGAFWMTNVHVMRRHPAFAPLRDDPRFQALLNDPKNNAPLF